MAKKVLSIEIGIHTTRVCEVEPGKKNPHISNCVSFDTPDNVVEDGFILDKDLMAQVLKKNLSAAKMTVKDVIFTITSTKIANREVVIPLVSENKIQPIIDASATEYFPVDVSEYTISYSILEKINTKEEKKLKLLLLAAPNNLIKNIYAFAETAGLNITAIDYIGNSAYQLLKKQVGTGVNVSVQINDQTTLVNVMENEQLALQRTIPYGAMNIVSAVLDNEVFDKHNSREAMLLLMQESIINAHLDMDGEGSHGMSMSMESYDKILQEIRGREDVTSTIQYIMNNVNRVLDYYMSRNSDKRINAIYLTGVGAKFKGIEVLFTNETGYDVKLIDSLFAVSFAKGLSLQGSQADYLTVIGASIAPVGFLPADARESARRTETSKVYTRLFAGCCIVAAGLMIGSLVNFQVAKFKNSSLEEEKSKKVYIEDLYATHAETKLAYEYAAYMYNQSTNRNYQLNEFREILANIMPANMQVLSMSSDGTMISMDIQSTDNLDAITELLLQLKTIPSVADVAVSAVDIEDEDSGKKESQEFTVTCSYVPFVASVEEKTSLEEQMQELLAQAEAGDTETTETGLPESEDSENTGSETASVTPDVGTANTTDSSEEE